VYDNPATYLPFGVERKKSAVASPTKRIERNPIFELELTKLTLC